MTHNNDNFDTRPIRPAHVPAPTLDPHQFDASDRSFAWVGGVVLALIIVSIMIVGLVR